MSRVRKKLLCSIDGGGSVLISEPTMEKMDGRIEVNILGWQSQKPWYESQIEFVVRAEKVCKQDSRQTCLIVTSSVRNTGPKFQETIMKCLEYDNKND